MEEVYRVIKKYATENQLSQEMVQALVDKIVVKDPEYVESYWKFSDKVRKIIGI